MKRFLATFLCLIPLLLHCQNRVTIVDAEIQFSIEIPEGWSQYDDAYTYYLILPSELGIEYLSLTYLETDDEDVDTNFDFALSKLYPLNEPRFEMITSEEDIVDDQQARWAIFNSSIEGIPCRNIIYMFIEYDQIFKIRGVSQVSYFNRDIKLFKRVIKSIKIKKLT